MSAQNKNRRVTVTALKAMKANGEKISVLTSYDSSFTEVIDAQGIDVILVGDSLGMVIQGHDSTVPVTVDDMIYHSKAVASKCKRALLMVDMPFMSYTSTAQALETAARLMQEGGGQMVKLESGQREVETVRRFSEEGVPVCAHIGLQPQLIHKLGGYRVQGRGEEQAAAMLDDAIALEQAGADALLLECVTAEVAAKITKTLKIPVIGIGAGIACDGQVLVLYDILGLTPGAPKFSRDFLQSTGSIAAAIAAFHQAVKDGNFPGSEHTFQ